MFITRMKVNSFQDRQNVIPGQEIAKYFHALPSISNYCQALQNLSKNFQELNCFQ